MVDDDKKNSQSAIWTADRLGRAKDAEFLKSFLVNRIDEKKSAGLPASYVLNIDARWGEGKSFFLDRFGKSLEAEGYLVAKVNAWQDDHADDPLLSVMAAIDLAVTPLVKRERQALNRWNAAKRAGAAIAVAAAKGVVVQVARKAIGSAVDEVGEILKVELSAEKSAEDISKALGESIGEQGKILLERFHEGKRTIEKFRETLGQFLQFAATKKQLLPLFVLVDELDRCRPPFAIAMLERMKHLFDIDQVVFVLATDTPQLSHSIGAVYGSGFNSEGYLSRFFNRTYYFDKVTRSQFIEELIRNAPLDEQRISLPPRLTVRQYLAEAFDFFALPLRDIEQVYDIVRSVITVWNLRVKVELVVLLPVAIAHQQRSELPLSIDVTSYLNRLAQKNGGAQPDSQPWKIEFATGSYPNQTEPTDGVNLFGAFVSSARQALHKLNHGATSTPVRWCIERLGDEFALLHGHMHSRAGGPYSVILQYPEMVRTAGRLLPKGRSDQ
ncbi:hypothetical protein ACVWWG_007467 [Bradyrhizobium sp. LB7.2]